MEKVKAYSKEYYELGRNYEENRNRLHRICKAVLKYNPMNVLDVGCGSGYLVAKIRRYGIDCVGLDFSENAGRIIDGDYIQSDVVKGLPFDDKTFDVITATAFFEHLKEEDIDFVYSEMQRVGNHIIAEIGYTAEKISDSHLTIKPYEWWKNKLPDCEIINK